MTEGVKETLLIDTVEIPPSPRGEGGKFRIPQHKVWLHCEYVTGEVTEGVKETLSIDRVEMLVGNDLTGKRIIPNLQMVEDPVKELFKNTTRAAVPNPSPQAMRNWCLTCFQSAL